MEKIIHQVAITDSPLSGYTPPNLDSIKKYFPKHDYIMWDYKKIKSLIVKNNDYHVLEAIDSVKANAFKADIARYYIIYKIGGWYTDLNNFFVSDPPDADSEIIFFRDVQHLTSSSWAVQVSLFCAKPRHFILKKALDQSVENVLSKHYGGHALCPTGPNLFGSSIAYFNLPENNSYIIGSMHKGKESGFYIDNTLFAKYKSNGLNQCESGLPGNNNYEQLWLDRELYL